MLCDILGSHVGSLIARDGMDDTEGFQAVEIFMLGKLLRQLNTVVVSMLTMTEARLAPEQPGTS